MGAVSSNANFSKAPGQTDIDIGRKVRFQRLLHGISQANLAVALSIARQQIQKYEYGTNRLRGDQLSTLSKLFNVPIEYFYQRDPERTGLPFIVQQNADDNLIRFVRSKEGKELNTYFRRLRDLEAQRLIVALVVSLSEEAEHGC
ncbi:helix-turn-helix domain-containing protein (plasmid) [Agrobacterium rosae]|uniref:Helix-turn-helix transcriptional regulator n=1 Tax=Agrobacterium rosae TaxID=1972867 RepID=A0ABU4W6U2_9HYPH|nr:MULTISPECIES: helix-turn-helix transcriptional regulator [Agrobacterium]MDX8311682.1 helix-turn-helix transcriptional regulator [Agrobacterium sp. rho-13.3]MDX8332641.1 helix-turn-helix transcriptional regulator [Agrobacterium rosae]